MIRPIQHVTESESENLLRSLLPTEWIIRKIPIDYGVDCEIEIVDNEVLSGNRIWIQLKGTHNPLQQRTITKKWTQEDVITISFPISNKLLEYSLSCPFPLLLFVADLSSDCIYWIPLQEEIRNTLEKRNSNWKGQITNTMRIRLGNRIDFGTRAYEGLRWYALESSRIYALMQLHVFIDSKLYGRQCSFEFADDFIEPFEMERMEEYLCGAQEVLYYAS